MTIGETYNALSGMTMGKTPGLDGLPMEFYVAFWPLVGQDLVDVVNHGFINQQLSISQHRAIITLVHKKDDTLEMKNWWPIIHPERGL